MQRRRFLAVLASVFVVGVAPRPSRPRWFGDFGKSAVAALHGREVVVPLHQAPAWCSGLTVVITADTSEMRRSLGAAMKALPVPEADGLPGYQ